MDVLATPGQNPAASRLIHEPVTASSFIHLPRSSDSVVLRVRGDLDLASAPVLAAKLEAARQTGSDVVVDLEQVEFMDCAGLHVLLDAVRGGSARQARIWVTPGPRQVQKLFELTGAGETLQIAPWPLRTAA